MITIAAYLGMTMINKLYEESRFILLLFLSIFILSACNGINIRIFPESIKETTDVSAILKYEATECIPFISCSYQVSILVPGNWEMYEKQIIIKPDEANKQYTEFTGIKSTLQSPGKYKLRSIELLYGDYSYSITDDNYDVDDEQNIQYENELKRKYDLNKYSFISYNDDLTTETNNQGRKVPLRIGFDPSMFPDENKSYHMDIPLPFSRVDKIDLHFTNNIFRRPASASTSDLMRASYNRAISYTTSRDYQLAIDSFTEAINLEPDLTEAYFGRGYAYDESGKHKQAIEDYTQAIELQSKNVEAYYNRGNSLNKIFEYKKAVDDFTEAIKYKPDHARAYLNRGISHCKLQLYQEAIDDFSAAIKYNPDDVGAYSNRGFVYDAMGNKELADRDFEKVKGLNLQGGIQ